MSILNMHFVVYERLASAKMEQMTTQINGHTHNGDYGVQIPYSYIYGQLDAGDFPTGAAAVITGAMIVDGSIEGDDIKNNTITINKFVTTGTTGLKVDANGYAVYAPDA